MRTQPSTTTPANVARGMQPLRLAYVAGSGVTALAVLAQGFLAGAGLLADPTWLPMHRMFGMVLSLFPLVLLGIGFAARLPKVALWLTGLLFVLIGLQPVLINAPEQLELPILKAFHVVNAMLIFALAAFLGHAMAGKMRGTRA